MNFLVAVQLKRDSVGIRSLSKLPMQDTPETTDTRAVANVVFDKCARDFAWCCIATFRFHLLFVDFRNGKGAVPPQAEWLLLGGYSSCLGSYVSCVNWLHHLNVDTKLPFFAKPFAGESSSRDGRISSTFRFAFQFSNFDGS